MNHKVKICEEKMSIETCKQDDTHLPAVVAERVVTKISAGAISPEENELIWFSRG